MSINETEDSENEEGTIKIGDVGFLQHDLNGTDLMQQSQRRSTIEPLPKDRKRKVQQRSKEGIMLDEATLIPKNFGRYNFRTKMESENFTVRNFYRPKILPSEIFTVLNFYRPKFLPCSMLTFLKFYLKL